MLGIKFKHKESSAEKNKGKDRRDQVVPEVMDTPDPVSNEEDKSTGQEDAVQSEPVQAKGEPSERPTNKPETEDKKLDVSPEIAGKKAEDAQEEKEENAVFTGLFEDVAEKEETPLDRLIDSLPDVSVHELLDEMEEVNTIMQDWKRL